MSQPIIVLDTNIALYYLGGRLAIPLPGDARRKVIAAVIMVLGVIAIALG
jgi:hypothetical protein